MRLRLWTLIAILVIVVATDILGSLLIAFLVDTKVIDFNSCFGILPTCGMLFLESKRIDDIPIYALLQLAWTALAFMVAIARIAPNPRPPRDSTAISEYGSAIYPRIP